MFVKDPHLVQDLTQKFCDYYKTKPIKVVNYYYDHTAVARTASTGISYAKEVINVLETNGWTVNAVYIGQAPQHQDKYLLWGKLLKGGDPRLPAFKYNISNCEFLIISMEGAQLKPSSKGVKKDKSTEAHPEHITPSEESTHFSDAGDTLIWGVMNYRFSERSAEGGGFDIIT